MANCSIGLYQTDITPEKNALVENIGQYLTNCNKLYVWDVQYFKHDLETTLKLSDTDLGASSTQNIVDTLSTFNYIGVSNSGEDAKGFYYFITGTKWISEKAIQLELRMDTINTFQDDILGHFTNKTLINRQHKDRFHRKSSAISDENKELMKIVDRVSEGINPPLINVGTVSALSENNKWVLMYVQSDDTQTLTANTYIYAMSDDVGFVVNSGGTLTSLNGTSIIDRAGTEIIKLVELPYEPFGVHAFEGILPSMPEHWEVVAVTNSTKGFVGSGNVLRLQIISDGKATGLNTPFETYLGSVILPDTKLALPYSDPLYLSVLNRSTSYEPKLNHSDFYNFKFLYDNFSKEIRYEDLANIVDTPTDTVTDKAFNITFYPSNNVSSKLMFKIAPSDTTAYRTISEYEDYLVSSRNLEPVRINDQFINYIRNGYNYDTKAHDIQTTASLINFGIKGAGSAISAVTAGAAGNYGSMANSFGSILSGAVNNIASEMSYENSLQAKLANLSAQGANVAGTDDLALFKVYNGNKLLISQYLPTADMRYHLYNLFYYTGYRLDRYGIPNLDSRRLFNFVQCDPVFNTEKKVEFAKYLKDVKERFNLGVTVFHKCAYLNQGYETQRTWDLAFNGKENWETWICPSIITIG